MNKILVFQRFELILFALGLLNITFRNLNTIKRKNKNEFIIDSISLNLLGLPNATLLQQKSVYLLLMLSFILVDTEVVSLVKLLIIDEVHLLNGNRGPVIEALVARTLRQVVSSQSMIRIVALSATLPGYLDVATFLKVNTRSGLFFFDNRFRSVPLTTSFIGVKKKNENDIMDMVCYEKVVNFIREGHQVKLINTTLVNTAFTVVVYRVFPNKAYKVVKKLGIFI